MTKRKLDTLKSILQEMQDVYRKMRTGKTPINDAVKLIRTLRQLAISIKKAK